MAKRMTAAETRQAFIDNSQNLKKTLELFSERPYVIGIDPSLTGAAVVICDITTGKLGFIRFRCANCFKRTTRRASTVFQRLELIRCYVSRIIRNFPARLVLIEGYAYNKTQNRELMGEVGHAIRDIMWRHPQFAGPTIDVAPTQLKKYISGQSTKVPKEKVMLNVYKQYGIDPDDNDEADAIVLAALGYDLLTRFIDVVKSIPINDPAVMGAFVKKAPSKVGVMKHQWEVLQAIVTSKCGANLFDYFNAEDWFSK